MDKRFPHSEFEPPDPYRERGCRERFIGCCAWVALVMIFGGATYTVLTFIRRFWF